MSEWISVNNPPELINDDLMGETLWSASVPVLVYYALGCIGIATYERWLDGETRWYSDGERWDVTESVVVWMPLPKKPEGVQGEDK